MKSIGEFIKECKIFFVATINDNSPANRPFGAIMQRDNFLYLSTGKNKDCFSQMVNNSKIQIVALKNGTREWVRINGIANEDFSIELKKEMLLENPILEKRYTSANDENFALIKVQILDYKFM